MNYTIDPNSWELVTNLELSATYDPLLVEFYIPPVMVEIQSSRLCQLKVTHIPTEPGWYWGGSVYQMLRNFDGSLIKVNRSVRIQLNLPHLLSFQWGESEAWNLVYVPPKYFKAINLKVWRYVGNFPPQPNV